jgi:predicted nucleic acid-binding protein
MKEAFEIAVEENISFYDSLFLAVSKKEMAPLLTLDKKLHERALKAKRDVLLV